MKRFCLCLVLAAFLGVNVGVAYAQPCCAQQGYIILSWWTTAPGAVNAPGVGAALGPFSSGGNYRLGAAIGQADTASSDGGSQGLYRLASGYWQAVPGGGCLNGICRTYLPVALKR